MKSQRKASWPAPSFWRTSSFCGDAGCIEVGSPELRSGTLVVPVRVSERPDDVQYVSLAEWHAHVEESKRQGRVDLTTWFPHEQYGSFAAGVSTDDAEKFEQGVLAGEFDLAR